MKLFPLIIVAFASQHLYAQPALKLPPASAISVGSVENTNTFSPPGGGLFGVTNSLAASQTNQSGTNLPPEIMAGLTNLQNNLISLLPQLAAFNNSFDFVSVNGTNRLSAGSGQSALPAPPSPGTNTGTTTNAASLIPLPATNAVVLSPRDTVRALLLLQDDLERTLPLLGALNGTNFPGFSQVPGLSTNTFASLTNNLQTLSTTIPTNRLTPTGR